MNYVPGIGPSNAKLAIVGEAPGAREDEEGIPFAGKTGKLVEECLEVTGLTRDEVYLTNVVKIRPPDNNLKRLDETGYSVEHFIPQLKEEIELLNPNCILALGNLALTTLTGHKGIKNYRGSILPGYWNPKVVPSIHPAALFKSEEDGGSGMMGWKDLTYIKWDFKRAYEESLTSDINLPQRNLIVCRDYLNLYNFLDRNSGNDIVSVDIETFRTIPICIGFAFNRNEAISVPLFSNLPNWKGMPRTELLYCWHEIAKLMANPEIKKIGQNFKFDGSLLDTCVNGELFYGIKTYGFFYDTLLAFKILYPELPGRLEFQTSVLTREPYYKEEGKGFNPKRDKFDRLLLYNAKDACVTFECYEESLRELQERGLEDFFFTRQMPLHHFYSRIESRGVKRDVFQQHFLLQKYSGQFKDLQAELDADIRNIAGGDVRGGSIEVGGEVIDCSVNVNSNGKNGDIPWLIYDLLEFPRRKGTDEKTLDALLRNHGQGDERGKILENVLKLRKIRKTIGTYIEAKSDYRGRLLTTCRISLETGRTATGILQPPVSTEAMGMAFQTITKHGDTGTDIRSQFIPDNGCVFIEADQRGAEARVVALLARDEKLLKMFRFEVDVHRVTKGWIDGTCPSLKEFFQEEDEVKCKEMAREINKLLKELFDTEARQEGKMFRHAANLGIKKRTASIQLGCSEGKAGKILKRVHETNPNIRGVFHKEIQEALEHNDMRLMNPFGRERVFLNKWGEELWKEAYAQIPQSTVSDQTKFAGRIIEKRLPRLQIFCESHDCISGQIPIPEFDKAVRVFTEEFERPIDFARCTLPRGILVIPCEIKIGKKNWEEMEEL